MDHLRFRRVCCTYSSLGIPGVLVWRVFCDPWTLFHHINWLWVLSWGSFPSSMGALGNACLVCPWRSLARFLSTSQALIDTLDLLYPLQYNHIFLEGSTTLQTDWSCPSCLGESVLLTLFIVFPLEGLLRLLKDISELVFIGVFPCRIHREAFRFSDRLYGSKVLPNCHPSSLWLAAVSGLVMDMRWQRGILNVLVLAMTIFHPYYLEVLLGFLSGIWSKWTNSV